MLAFFFAPTAAAETAAAVVATLVTEALRGRLSLAAKAATEGGATANASTAVEAVIAPDGASAFPALASIIPALLEEAALQPSRSGGSNAAEAALLAVAEASADDSSERPEAAAGATLVTAAADEPAVTVAEEDAPAPAVGAAFTPGARAACTCVMSRAFLQ